MSNIKVVLNIPGLCELRTSDMVKQAVDDAARAVAARAGNSELNDPHYSAGRQARYIVSVRQNMTSDDMEGNTLLKAMR